MIIQELKPSKRVRGRWLAVLEDGSLLRWGRARCSSSPSAPAGS